MSRNKKTVNLGALRYTQTSFGTIVRTGDGNIAGVFPTEQEAYEYFESERMEETNAEV